MPGGTEDMQAAALPCLAGLAIAEQDATTVRTMLYLADLGRGHADQQRDCQQSQHNHLWRLAPVPVPGGRLGDVVPFQGGRTTDCT